MNDGAKLRVENHWARMSPGHPRSDSGLTRIVEEVNAVIYPAAIRVAPVFATCVQPAAEGREFTVVCELVVQLGEFDGDRFIVFAESSTAAQFAASTPTEAERSVFLNALEDALSLLCTADPRRIGSPA